MNKVIYWKNKKKQKKKKQFMFPTALKWFQTFYAASFLLKNP